MQYNTMRINVALYAVWTFLAATAFGSELPSARDANASVTAKDLSTMGEGDSRMKLREEYPDLRSIIDHFEYFEGRSQDAKADVAAMQFVADSIRHARPSPEKCEAIDKLAAWAISTLDRGHPAIERWEVLRLWTEAIMVNPCVVPSCRYTQYKNGLLKYAADSDFLVRAYAVAQIHEMHSYGHAFPSVALAKIAERQKADFLERCKSPTALIPPGAPGFVEMYIKNLPFDRSASWREESLLPESEYWRFQDASLDDKIEMAHQNALYGKELLEVLKRGDFTLSTFKVYIDELVSDSLRLGLLRSGVLGTMDKVLAAINRNIRENNEPEKHRAMLAWLVDRIQAIKPGNEWSRYLIEEALADAVSYAALNPDDFRENILMLKEVEPAYNHLLLLITERDCGYDPNLFPKGILRTFERVALVDKTKRGEITNALEQRLESEKEKKPQSDVDKESHQRLISRLEKTLAHIEALK
jgi:hypothetical protein